MDTKLPVSVGEATAVSHGPGEGAELDAALERVRSLVEEGDVAAACAHLQELEERWPDAEGVRYWARVLAPPVVRLRPGEQGRPLDRERAWLRQHSNEYPGCWLAVYGDRLIAADRDLRAVLQVVGQTPGAESALLFFEPLRPE